MGKYLTSLLILVVLFLPPDAFGGEQTRRVQEELRKRHLFYDNLNGQYTPALADAIRRYQERKGFTPSGIIDSQTLASLGITGFATPAQPATAPDGRRLEFYGPNGESLPRPPAVDSDGTESFDSDAVEHVYLDRQLRPRHWWPQPPDISFHAMGVTGRDRDGLVPFDIDFELTNERLHRSGNGGMENPFVLASRGAVDLVISGMEKDDTEQASKPKGRSGKQARRVRQRKATNPFILAFQSVDRAVRNLFDDAPTRKKRVATKRD